jgi:hypothetical protein
MSTKGSSRKCLRKWLGLAFHHLRCSGLNFAMPTPVLLLSQLKLPLLFLPFRAATAIPAAVSSMSATTATGGVARSTIATTPTTGACTTTASTRIGTTAIRVTCRVFVALWIRCLLSEPRWAGFNLQGLILRRLRRGVASSIHNLTSCSLTSSI